jgi:aminoglycoside phosphotransferase (APT) family kinase protein
VSAQRFDEAALTAWLRGRLPGFDGEVQVTQFQAGQSNPTYRIDTPAGAYVLRKKPAGVLVPSAHAIDREFRVLQALEGRLPVPRAHLFCKDEAVIGQAFYLMDLVPGRVLPDARLLEAPRAERAAMSLELVRVLARLHRVDYREVGLEGFGRAEGYVARQLARWSKQWTTSRVEDNPDMDGLIGWLEANLPAEDETSVVHGDYRSHNVIFAPQGPRIDAVLDWELATLGHPIADLAYCLLPYHLPADDERGFHGESLDGLGVPSEAEMLAAYAAEAGRAEIPHWRYAIVFALFRSAAIRAGIYKRALDGTAANAQALAKGMSYRGTAAHAWRLAQETTDA